MEYNRAFDDKQNKLLEDQAKGPGLYQMEKSLKTSKPAYPWAPGCLLYTSPSPRD